MNKQRSFTGGQIATMVVAVCAVLVLAPVGALAVTGQLVNITDPVTAANKARVNSSGQLRVSGPVSVTNQPTSIRANPGVPAAPFAKWGNPITAPAGKRLVVETVSVQCNKTSGSGNIEAFVSFISGGQQGRLFLSPAYAYFESGTGYYFYTATEAVKLYVDGGTNIAVDCYAGAGGGTPGTSFVAVSGYRI